MELPYNKVISFDDGNVELVISEVHDNIRRFRQTPAYDYLQYWDVDDNCMRAFWLGKQILDLLVEGGIPETWRDKITQEEFDLYTDSCDFTQGFEQQFEGYEFGEDE